MSPQQRVVSRSRLHRVVLRAATELHLYAKYDAMAATTPNKMGAADLLKQMQLNDSVDNPSGTRSDARYLTWGFRNTVGI